MPPANYSANLAAIWATLAATGAQIVWATTTPVLFGSTPDPCTYCRNESSVLLYNSLALKALTAAAAKTSATPLRVNDLWADLTSFCGEGYKSCKLQLAGGVHCTELAVPQAQAVAPSDERLSALLDGFAEEHEGCRPTHTLAGFVL